MVCLSKISKFSKLGRDGSVRCRGKDTILWEVERNAFGRQRYSFEKNIQIKGFKEPFNAVFIRAPEIKKVWDNCEIIAKIDKKIIMVRQDNMIALSFHPELTDDFRVHKYFLDMILSFHYSK